MNVSDVISIEFKTIPQGVEFIISSVHITLFQQLYCKHNNNVYFSKRCKFTYMTIETPFIYVIGDDNRAMRIQFGLSMKVRDLIKVLSNYLIHKNIKDLLTAIPERSAEEPPSFTQRPILSILVTKNNSYAEQLKERLDATGSIKIC